MKRRAIAAMVMIGWAVAGPGCRGATWKPEGSAPPAGEAAYFQADHPPFGGTYVKKIDGRLGKPSFGPKQYIQGRYPLWPGVHTVVASKVEGDRIYTNDGEITFVAEKGHTYKVVDWPPKVVDVTSRHAVSQRLRAVGSGW